LRAHDDDVVEPSPLMSPADETLQPAVEVLALMMKPEAGLMSSVRSKTKGSGSSRCRGEMTWASPAGAAFELNGALTRMSSKPSPSSPAAETPLPRLVARSP
jgi:hypothetical protein